MPRPNDAAPFVGFLPENTKVQCHVAAYSSLPQRVTVIIPNIAEHTFEGSAATNVHPAGQTTKIGGDFIFTTGSTAVQAECWNEEKPATIWKNYRFEYWDGNSVHGPLPYSMRGRGTLIYFAVDATVAVPIPSMPPQVDEDIAYLHQGILWMWNGHGACMKPECVFYAVEAVFGVSFTNGSLGTLFPNTWRGIRSPHDCVQEAKRQRSSGHPGMAIAWLQAGQLHNPGFQQLIAQYADEALNFIGGL